MFCTVNKYARVAFRFGLHVQGRGVGMTHGQCDAGLLKTTLVRFVVQIHNKSHNRSFFCLTVSFQLTLVLIAPTHGRVARLS